MSDDDRDAPSAPGSSPDSRGVRHERIRVRRRVSRHVLEARRQVKSQARQRRTSIIVLSAGVLVLMVLGLYYGLAHHDSGPGLQGARWLAPIGAPPKAA